MELGVSGSPVSAIKAGEAPLLPSWGVTSLAEFPDAEGGEATVSTFFLPRH